MRGLLLSVIVYCIVAFAFFGDPLPPLALLTLWHDRLGAPWPVFVIGSAAIAALVFLLPLRVVRFRSVKLPLFVFVGMVLSIASTTIYVDRARQKGLADFDADATFQHSFLRSLRKAPREFQTFLHAAALKDCVPYGWSYRTMDLYRLLPDVAGNVVPRAWIERCAIGRS